ncbi:hypothetical protein [Sulfurimonas marina]|uniref:Uncharacterized protein n=1 Tax=Sulfurimonas marina TaxID=2590551 RepID=A0A7M1AXF6_9BACT|nr:hypothetical protein [Sulfurimonas marina]QOP42147.1 hypothetical protein FJR03_10535 [Sulfurimonas marina]
MSHIFENVTLSLKDIIHYRNIVIDTVGSKWLNKKIQQEKQKREKDSKESSNRKHMYLFRKTPHPLVQWAIEFEKWKEESLKTKKIVLTESILKIFITW